MTYLSIDLDYWLGFSQGDDPPLQGLFRMLRNVKADSWLVVDEHHHLLPHIEQHDPQQILHVDYHTDVAFEVFEVRRGKRVKVQPIDLNCGTFFWFLKNRKNMQYTWFYPEGECPRSSGLCMPDEYKPLARCNWIFQEQRRKLGLPLKRQLAQVTAVGIAASEDFCVRDERLIRLLRVLKSRYVPKHSHWQLPEHLAEALKT